MTDMPVYRFADFTLHPADYCLFKDGRQIRLRPKAFEALLYLVERHQRLVKKEQLLTNLWPEVLVTENALNKCIDDARRALGDDARNPVFIETIPRLGFKFIAEVDELQPKSPETNEVDNPGGTPPKPQLTQQNTVRQRRGLILFAAILLIILLVFAGWWGYKWLFNNTVYKEGLAVLPMINLSGDQEQDYFVDGMTEELISTISKIPAIKVIAHTSVMQYKKPGKSTADIARELNVGHLLAGSVRKAGNMVRITVQLIDAQSQESLWSQDYDRELKGIFEIQTDIAHHVADALKVRLLTGDKRGIAKQPTQNLEAYILYLKGRHQWNSRTEQGFKKSFEYFNQAIEIDPNFALAFCGLADSYSWFTIYHIIPGEEAFQRASWAVNRALEIDNQLADAHISRAVILENYNWDWLGAEKEYKQAIALNPHNANAHKEYSEFLMFQGQFDLALSEANLALDLDPLGIVMNANLGHILYRSRRYDDAIRKLQKVMEMSADNLLVVPAWHLGLALVQNGMPQEAIKELEQQKTQSGNSPDLLSALAYSYAIAGKKELALQMIDEIKTQFNKPDTYYHFDLSIILTMIYTGLGDTDKAFQWLEKAYNERASAIIFVKTEPFLDPLRSDPRFMTLLEKLGFE